VHGGQLWEKGKEGEEAIAERQRTENSGGTGGVRVAGGA
jgi:hypothetical protein